MNELYFTRGVEKTTDRERMNELNKLYFTKVVEKTRERRNE